MKRWSGSATTGVAQAQLRERRSPRGEARRRRAAPPSPGPARCPGGAGAASAGEAAAPPPRAGCSSTSSIAGRGQLAVAGERQAARHGRRPRPRPGSPRRASPRRCAAPACRAPAARAPAKGPGNDGSSDTASSSGDGPREQRAGDHRAEALHGEGPVDGQEQRPLGAGAAAARAPPRSSAAFSSGSPSPVCAEQATTFAPSRKVPR